MGNTSRLCGNIDLEQQEHFIDCASHPENPKKPLFNQRTIEKISYKPVFHKINQLSILSDEASPECNHGEDENPVDTVEP